MRRGRHLVLAECGESARQAASEDTYPLTETGRAVVRFNTAPQRSGQKSPGQATARPYVAFVFGVGTYDRARTSLDRQATYIVAAFIAGAAR